MVTALIILNYNNASDTRNCLLSVSKYNSSPIKIIVVDNGSKKEDVRALTKTMEDMYGEKLWQGDASEAPKSAKAIEASCALLLSGDNLGYGRGNNLGLGLAYVDPQVDKVMILNNDILFVEDILPRLVEFYDFTEDCGVVSPILYKKDLKTYDLNCARRNVKVGQLIKKNVLHYFWRMIGKNVFEVQKDRYYLLNDETNEDVLSIELPSGSCMLMDKKLFKNIGSFDPNTFLYYEENILFKKLQDLHLKNYLLKDVKCVHLGAATTSSLPNSLWLFKVSQESEQYYVKNYSQANSIVKMLHRLSLKFSRIVFSIQKKLKNS